MNKTAIQEADILNDVKNFALNHITPHRETLITSPQFPEELWLKFGESGLAGLSVPTEFGGSGAKYQTLSAAAHILNEFGGVPGVTMVFMAHWQFIKLHIAGEASADIQKTLLPLLQDGSITLSVAISEPGAGAHPKHLKTTAIKDGDDFIVNGEKAFLTNGPLASHFIVLAITNETEGKKAFSAILVPAETVGFQRNEGVKIDFLHPCPHGGIQLNNCRIPLTNLIGAEGDAFERTSLRMRAIEDAAGAAGHVGSLSCLLKDIVPHLLQTNTMEVGAISTQLQALDVIANKLAQMADNEEIHIQIILELQLGFRQLIGVCTDAVQALLKPLRETLPSKTLLLARDITKFHGIAQNAHMARLAKIGSKILGDSI